MKEEKKLEKEDTIEKVEVREEKPEKKPRKSSVIGRIINIIIWLIVLAILAMGIIGYINFGRIQNEEEPYLLMKQENYQEGTESFEVYHFGFYKIVKQYNDTNYSYSIKLWFMDDAVKK